LPGLDEGATLTGVGPISDGLAAALACDSALTPVVVGSVDHDALDAMTDEWLHAHGLADRCGCAEEASGTPDVNGTNVLDAGGSGHHCDHGLPPGARARLRNSLLGWAVDVLSGPGGLASYLRTGLLDDPIGTPSIVLDAGTEDRTGPASLERLVRRRDRRCRFPGCAHPAELSQVHHLIPRAQNGPAALSNLLTLCQFHHLIAVHTWGWTLRLNPDGTVTATGPDRRVLHENDPPGDPPLLAA
jgi:hypothetical protein